MNKKRKFVIITLSCILIFMFSYTITIGVLARGRETEASFTSSNNAVVTKKSKIKFILNYKNSLDTVYSSDKLSQPIHIDEEELQGLSMDEIQEIFSSIGFKISKFDEDEIILVKDMNSYDYDAGSYFIGINDGKVAILSRDTDDKITVVQAEIPNPKYDDSETGLTIKDIENKGSLMQTLYEGCSDYQFSDIQEAMEYAQALCST